MQDSVTYLIAGHRLRVSGMQEVSLLDSMPGFPLFVDASATDGQWKVAFGQEVLRPEQWTLLYEYTGPEGYPWCFARTDEACYFMMQHTEPGIAPLLMRYDGGDTVVATHAFSPSVMRFALWMATGMLAAACKMVLIHSSVVVHHGRAVLVLGESGTGKSTHTRLWMSHIPDTHLLNDDSPAVVIENGVPMVYGSPWSGKTHCYHTACFPLAAAVRLSQAPHNHIRRLGTLEAFTALEPSFPPALMRDERLTDKFIPTIGDIISSVPVFHLECLPDADAAQTSCAAIFGTLS